MNKKHIITYIILLFSVCSMHLNAQEKYEKESRLKTKYVPSKAIDFVDSLSIDRKVKWYLDEELDSKTIEAKFKFNNSRHSIEFDTLGNILDVEIDTKWQTIDISLTSKIEQYLKENCFRYNIQKAQIQYTGNSVDLKQKIINGKESKEVSIKYEVVVKCKSSEGLNLLEYLFDQQGNIISRYRIIFNNSSHLEY